jgi:hypothetical protein
LNSSGKTDFFYTYEKQFRTTWEAIDRLEIDRPIHICLAHAFPKLKGWSFELTDDLKKAIGILRIDSPISEVMKWRPLWLELNLCWQLERLGIETAIDTVQVHAAYHRLILAQTSKTQVSIFPISRSNPKYTGQSYTIKGYNDSDEISLAIGNIDDCCSNNRLDEIMKKITQAVSSKVSCATDNVSFCIFEKQIQRFLNSAQNSPQSIGIGGFPTTLAALIRSNN